LTAAIIWFETISLIFIVIFNWFYPIKFDLKLNSLKSLYQTHTSSSKLRKIIFIRLCDKLFVEWFEGRELFTKQFNAQMFRVPWKHKSFFFWLEISLNFKQQFCQESCFVRLKIEQDFEINFVLVTFFVKFYLIRSQTFKSTIVRLGSIRHFWDCFKVFKRGWHVTSFNFW
jgi:hypothetical protein